MTSGVRETARGVRRLAALASGLTVARRARAPRRRDSQASGAPAGSEHRAQESVERAKPNSHGAGEPGASTGESSSRNGSPNGSSGGATFDRTREEPTAAAREPDQVDASRRPAPRQGSPWKVDFFGVLRRRWWIISLCVVFVPIGPLIWIIGEQPTYRSQSLIAVAPPAPEEPDYVYVPAFETARTVRDVLLSRGVAIDTSEALGGQPSASEVEERISAEAEPEGWQTIELSSEGPSQEAAQDLNQAVIDAALPAARRAARARSRIVTAVGPSPGESIERARWPQVIVVIGLVGLIGLILATVVDVIAALRRSTE